MTRILLALMILLSSQPLMARTMAVLGDSISAGYGLEASEAWVVLLQKKLNENHSDYTIVNESISGETSAGGLARIDTVLSQRKPSLLLLELGGNDGLFGLPLELMKSNLSDIIQRARAKDTKVLLLAMRIPPNYGKRYIEKFYQTYQDIAKHMQIPLTPFILEDIALDKDLMQADGIHPNAKAQALIVEKIWPHLQPLLK